MTQIIVMAKLPRAGKTKTRLVPPVTAQQAADVQRVFLRHVSRRLRTLGDVTICFDPPDGEAAMRRLAGTKVKLLPQAVGDLSARLTAAFNAVSPQTTFFMGVDSPDVPSGAVQNAMQLLQANDVVVGPCGDGGYWCLGLSRSVDAALLLQRVEWSSGHEFTQTCDRARSLGYRLAVADAWDDVDRADDLRRLVTRLRKSDNAWDMQLLQDLQFLPHEVMS